MWTQAECAFLLSPSRSLTFEHPDSDFALTSRLAQSFLEDRGDRRLEDEDIEPLDPQNPGIAFEFVQKTLKKQLKELLMLDPANVLAEIPDLTIGELDQDEINNLRKRNLPDVEAEELEKKEPSLETTRGYTFQAIGLDWLVVVRMMEIEGNKKTNTRNFEITIAAIEKQPFNDGKKKDETSPWDRPVYEEKHLFALPLSRQTWGAQFDASVKAIFFGSSTTSIQFDKLKPPSIKDVNTEFKEVLTRIFKSKSETDTFKDKRLMETKTKIMNEFSFQLKENKSKTQFNYELKIVGYDFGLIVLKHGSSKFSMNIPLRGFNQPENKLTRERLEVSITAWVDKRIDLENKSLTIESVALQANVHEIIKNELTLDNGCYRLPDKESETEKKSTDSRVVMSFVNSDSKNDLCKHDNEDRNSSEHLNIYFTHFNTHSLNYGHLFIDSDSQAAEYLIDFSSNYEERLKDQITEFIESDRFKLKGAKGTIFTSEDLKKNIEVWMGTDYKCEILPIDTDKVPKKPELSCSYGVNDEKYNEKNEVLRVKYYGNNPKISLSFPPGFDRKRLLQPYVIKNGIPTEFNLENYNSYNQIEKIKDDLIYFLSLVGPDELLSEDIVNKKDEDKTTSTKEEVKNQSLEEAQPNIIKDGKETPIDPSILETDDKQKIEEEETQSLNQPIEESLQDKAKREKIEKETPIDPSILENDDEQKIEEEEKKRQQEPNQSPINDDLTNSLNQMGQTSLNQPTNIEKIKGPSARNKSGDELFTKMEPFKGPSQNLLINKDRYNLKKPVKKDTIVNPNKKLTNNQPNTKNGIVRALKSIHNSHNLLNNSNKDQINDEAAVFGIYKALFQRPTDLPLVFEQKSIDLSTSPNSNSVKHQDSHLHPSGDIASLLESTALSIEPISHENMIRVKSSSSSLLK